MNLICRIVSILFSPLLMPTYAMAVIMWGTYMRAISNVTKWSLTAITFGVTCMIPIIVIYIMHRLGRVTDPGLNERNERTVPYVVSILTLLGMAFYMVKLHAPEWMSMFWIGAAFMVITNLLVNLKWKISGHAAGVGALTAMTFFLCLRSYTFYNNDWLFLGSFIAMGVVMSARVLMGRHTLLQVLAGAANGIFWISLSQLV